MDNYSSNGLQSQLAEFETPFADVMPSREEEDRPGSSFTSEQMFSELETPFSQSFDASGESYESNPNAAEYVQLLAELNDREFSSNLYAMASELEDSWSSKISNETALGDRFVPFATQQGNEYFAPLIGETEAAIDKAAEYFSGNNLADHNEAEIDRFFTELEFGRNYTPAQEQFFGSILKKVKSVVKAGVNLAKKGISAVGKLIPLGPILKKLKSLVRPLLEKVLRFAIGKLPATLRPYADKLAKQFLNLESSENYAEENETTPELESIQTEFDTHVAQLVFSGNETEGEDLVSNYEHSEETGSLESSETSTSSLDAAREQFIEDLKNLKQGESPAPAIERFLPVIMMARPAIRLAISLIGRQKIINFLAGLLAKLVSKYVPQQVVMPLASNIIDVGMSAIGFETYEVNKPDVGYEAIANTIQETIQNLSLDEGLLNDQETLAAETLEAFETAATNNFPANYLRKDLVSSSVGGVWVMKPRKGPKQYYKKFTHVFPATIYPRVAKSIKTFGDVPLFNFLRDCLGVDPTKPIQARVHLYEAIKGTMLSRIAKYDKAKGLGVPNGYVQLHPLSMCTAAMLIKEPLLGKDVSSNFTVTRNRIGVGQRFYYLEIEGAHLRALPQKKGPIYSQTSDIQGVINFIKSEIRLNYFFSEEEAKTVVEKLNRNDYLGAALSIRYSVRNVLQSILVKNIPTKVKIIHEAVPELYLENYSENYADQQEQFAPLAAVGRLAASAGKEVISKLIEKIVDKLTDVAYYAIVNYFKARAAEFKQAQANPADGVTVKIIWVNIPGMSKIRAIINAIRGNFSVGNLMDLALPSIPTPEIQVKPGKQFD